MKLKIWGFLLIAFLGVSVNLYASNEMSFGYFESNKSKILNFKNKNEFFKKNIKITPFIKHQRSDAGQVFNAFLEADKDLGDKFDVFINTEYMDDQVLEIDSRLDYKIGAGYYLYKEGLHKHKVSYALVKRARSVVNSFRYKYTYKGSFLRNKAIFYYITPTEEVRGELETSFKLFKTLAIVLSHEYAYKDGLTNYNTYGGFTVIY